MEILVDDNLLSIFDLLSAESLKNAVNSCIRWNSIAQNNLAMMRKLKFNYNLQDLNLNEYRNVIIGPKIDAYLEQFCHENKQSIEILHLKHIFKEPAVSILAILSNITHLTLHTRSLEYNGKFDINDYHPIELPNLRFLNSFSPILQVIYKHQVQEFVVQARIFDDFRITKVEAESVRKFLMNCPDLITLTVEGAVEFYSAEPYNFKLKTLHCSNDQFNLVYPRNGFEKFRNFLLSQKDSLKELTLNCKQLTQKNFILSDLKLTKYHDLSFNLLMNYEEEIVPSTTIKDLKIQGFFLPEKSLDYFQAIVINCPLVEKLDLLHYHCVSYQIINQLGLLIHLKELKLRIPLLTTYEVIEHSVFEHLKHLQVYIELEHSFYAETLSFMLSIIHCCPFLTFLHLKYDMRYESFFNEAPIYLDELLTPLKMLEELHLEGFVLNNYQFIFNTNVLKIKIFTKTPENHAHLSEVFNCTHVRLSIISE